MSNHDQGVFYDYIDNLCSNCQKETSQLKLCGGCGVTQYCSKECQAHHWKSKDLGEFTHQNWCKKLKVVDMAAKEGNYQPLDEFSYILANNKKEIEIMDVGKENFSDSDDDDEDDDENYNIEADTDSEGSFEEGEEGEGDIEDEDDDIFEEEGEEDVGEEGPEGEDQEDGGIDDDMGDGQEPLGDDGDFLDEPPTEIEIAKMIESDLADLEELQGEDLEHIGRWVWHGPSQSWAWRTGIFLPIFWLLFGWRPYWWRPRRFFGRRLRRSRPLFQPRFSRAARRRLDRWRSRNRRPGNPGGRIPGRRVPGRRVPGRRVPGRVPGRRVPGRIPGRRVPGRRIPVPGPRPGPRPGPGRRPGPRPGPGRRIPGPGPRTVPRPRRPFRPLRPLRPFVPPILRI